MRAVIYLRVSTKEQAEEGYSIPAQAEACRRFIADRGWELVEEYVDRGESARTADRPQLQAMLALSPSLAEMLDWLAELAADLDQWEARIGELEDRLPPLLDSCGSTLAEEFGIGVVSASELVAAVGDPSRFKTEGGLARWCGVAPVAVSSNEGDGQPIRHRLDLLGNRQGEQDPLHDVGDPGAASALGEGVPRSQAGGGQEQEGSQEGPQATARQASHQADVGRSTATASALSERPPSPSIRVA